MQATDRWTEIRTIHHEHHFFYQIMGGAALVALGILLGAAIFAQDEGYATNLYTEILSIGVTVFILNLLAERREETRRIRDLKAQLVRDAGSQSNEAALRAVNEIAKQDWLTGEDGLLKGADLGGANLEGVNLRDANLQGTNLWLAKLQNANLGDADLQGANLLNADLRDANLEYANLQGADLESAKLQGVDMYEVNLQDTNLRRANLQSVNLYLADLCGADLRAANLKDVNLVDANLQDANLYRAEFDESTILPDGSKWTPDTDMTCFTDPDHPDFWRSDDSISPAY